MIILRLHSLLPLFLTFYYSFSLASVLPDERADMMYHRYDGGGMVIDGPSILIRKNIANKVSIASNYYVDKVSSASIDVLTQGASKYSEKRTEYSADISFLEDNTLINTGFTSSTENDYEARNYRLDVSHEFFGQMSSFSAGLSIGEDTITSTTNPLFEEELERKNYRIGFGQILTKKLILNINYEAVLDEGYLQNPYRKILFVSQSKADAILNPPDSYELKDELYPRTRNSDSFSLKLAYHLPWSGAIKTKLGYYSDSWDISGKSIELDYSHKLANWLFDIRLRHYTQDEADFYANVFYTDTETNFKGRDKELSHYTSDSIGLGVRYTWEDNLISGFSLFNKISFNTQIDYMMFDYNNFREVTNKTALKNGVEAEPLYDFNAYALRIFFTIYY